ncbi:MAG: hypothetical protein ACE5IR_05320 [bacterium]
MPKPDGKDNVTKQELENTKQELLDKLVTKKEFRTEIDKLVTKTEFRSEIKRLDGSIELLANQVGKNTLEIQKLRGEMNGLHSEMNGLRGEMAELRSEVDELRTDMNNKFNTVLSAIDGLAGQIRDMHTEKAAGEHTFRRHENRLDEHDLRIKKIEEKIG